MKKRFMSLLLAVVMVFGVVSPSFAADTPDNSNGIEPFNNRYYYVYETEPTGKTASEKEAAIKDTIKGLLSKGIATALGSSLPPSEATGAITAITESFFKNVYAQEPFARAGTYKISMDKKYKYRVDRLDESRRYVEDSWLVSHYKLYQNGKLVDSFTYQLKMK